MLLLLTPLLFGLSFLSGMLGLGVAFIAIPVLGLFGYDLINVIQPWTLLLNGLTAISAAIAFWRKGMVDKRGALILVTITTVCAPIGVWLLQFATVDLVWWLYVGVLLFLAVRMAMPKGASTEVVAEITDASRAKAAGAAVPISVFAGFLGVGPGFLLMPTLTLVGYSARLAAATNSVAVTLPSFSAFVTHLPIGHVRLADRDRHLDRLGDRRMAGRPLHGGAREERHPFAHLRGRARSARRPARLDPADMTTTRESTYGTQEETPDAD
jgi:uncharacterized membrane protein YfcA